MKLNSIKPAKGSKTTRVRVGRGIGSGKGGGVGSGTGGGAGSGAGGGIVYLPGVSSGVTKPIAIHQEKPEYSEEAVSAYMKRDKVVITADIGVGRSSAKVWTCDLTKEYVAINGDYRS